MKQIGNLAIVCARRKDVTLRIEQGRVMVMLDGQVVESGLTDQILEDPQHAYTQQLVHSLL